MSERRDHLEERRREGIAQAARDFRTEAQRRGSSLSQEQAEERVRKAVRREELRNPTP